MKRKYLLISFLLTFPFSVVAWYSKEFYLTTDKVRPKLTHSTSYTSQLDSIHLMLIEGQKSKGDRQLAKAYFQLGQDYYSSGQFSKAVALLEKAISLYESFDDRGQIMTAMNTMGLCYWKLGLYSQVMEVYLAL